MKVVLVERGGGLEREVRAALREHGSHVLESLPDADADGARMAGEADAVIDLAEPEATSARTDASRARTAQQLLRDASGRAGRYVFVSSVLVYAPVPSPDSWPIQEHYPREAHGDPSSHAYGQDCIDAEDIIIREWAPRGLRYAILRPAVLCGSATANVSSGLLEEARRRPWAAARKYAAAGVMQWVDVRDAARAVVLAATEPTVDKDILTIAGPDGFTGPDVVDALWQGPGLLDDARPLKFDTAKAGVVLGWRPEHRISESLATIGSMGFDRPAAPSYRPQVRWQPDWGGARQAHRPPGMSEVW